MSFHTGLCIYSELSLFFQLDQELPSKKGKDDENSWKVNHWSGNNIFCLKEFNKCILWGGYFYYINYRLIYLYEWNLKILRCDYLQCHQFLSKVNLNLTL